MRLLRKGIAAFCCLGALVQVGCGFTASPAEGIQFTAPPSWKPSPGIMGMMQFWRSPSKDRDVLMLFKSPKPIDMRGVFSSGQMRQQLRDITIERTRAVQICGNQPATYFQARGSSADNGDVKVDMMMTVTRGNGYFAMYIRPFSEAPDPSAVAALSELCAKP